MQPFRSLILTVADNEVVRRGVTTAPVARSIVRRFVAGESTADAVTATSDLLAHGLTVTLDYLGENVADRAVARRTVRAYDELLDALSHQGLASNAEVSVKLSALGQGVDERFAEENAREICQRAERVGTTVTLDMEDHTTTDSTLRVLANLRNTWPWIGAVVQAYLHRTVDDCRALSADGARVRLCKGAYAEPATVAYQDPHQVNLSYVRCANVLLAGAGYPMFATHDPRLVEIIAERAKWYGRKSSGFEYQMLYGIRPDEQRRLAEAGNTVRVYVPYGDQWYGYLIRRLAERPANLSFFLRSVLTRK